MQRRALVGKGAGPTPIADGSDDVMEGGSSGTSTSTSTRLSIGETPSSLGNSAPFQPPSADTKGSANRRRGNSMLTMFGRGDSDAAIDEINAKAALEQSMRLQMMSRPTESCLHVVNILQLQVPGSPSYSWGDKQSSSSSSIGMGIDAFKAVPITPSPPSAADALAVLSLDDDDDGGDDDDEKTTGTSTGSGTSTGAGTGNSGVDSSNEGGDTPDSNSSRDGGETHIYVHNSTGLMSLARPAGLEYICTPVDVTNVQTNASTADAAVSGSAQKDKEGEKEGDCSVIVLVSLSEINKGTLKERGGGTSSNRVTTTLSIDTLASALAARLTEFHRNSIPIVPVSEPLTPSNNTNNTLGTLGGVSTSQRDTEREQSIATSPTGGLTAAAAATNRLALASTSASPNSTSTSTSTSNNNSPQRGVANGNGGLSPSRWDFMRTRVNQMFKGNGSASPDRLWSNSTLSNDNSATGKEGENGGSEQEDEDEDEDEEEEEEEDGANRDRSGRNHKTLSFRATPALQNMLRDKRSELDAFTDDEDSDEDENDGTDTTSHANSNALDSDTGSISDSDISDDSEAPTNRASHSRSRQSPKGSYLKSLTVDTDLTTNPRPRITETNELAEAETETDSTAIMVKGKLGLGVGGGGGDGEEVESLKKAEAAAENKPIAEVENTDTGGSDVEVHTKAAMIIDAINNTAKDTDNTDNSPLPPTEAGAGGCDISLEELQQALLKSHRQHVRF